MSMLDAALRFALAALAGAALVAPVLHGLRRRGLLDRPNARSLHVVPVPRGGGVAVVVVVMLVHAAELIRTGPSDPGDLAWPLIALAVGVLGWLDDWRPRPAGLRLAAQFFLAVAFVFLVLPSSSPAPLALARGLLLVGLVTWSINLYNFVDGTDGFAATQALCGLGGALLLPEAAMGPGVAPIVLALAGACAGFLWWNRPPARIFMGDVGSYFIGFELVALVLIDVHAGGSAWVWAILFLPILGDTALTLARRVRRGERWWLAHREHAYQRLVLGGWSHARLLRALVAFNLGVCWPLAWWARNAPATAPLALGVGVVVVTAVWIRVVSTGPRA
jgi:Fuc2NAc and GlcNAc transferase